MIQVASPEIESIQLMAQVGFPRNYLNQTRDLSENIDSESTQDSALRCMDAWNWFAFIRTQLAFSKLDPAEWQPILLK